MGTEATFQCAAGYQAEANATFKVTCGFDGQWWPPLQDLAMCNRQPICSSPVPLNSTDIFLGNLTNIKRYHEVDYLSGSYVEYACPPHMLIRQSINSYRALCSINGYTTMIK